MSTKSKSAKPQIKVTDMKPRKDAKGGRNRPTNPRKGVHKEDPS